MTDTPMTNSDKQNFAVKRVLGEALKKSLAKGWVMKKQLTPSHWIPGGFLTSGVWVEAVYDTRTVRSMDELQTLVKEGFLLDHDKGRLIFDALWEVAKF